MGPGPDESQGIGTPSDAHPGFAPAAGVPFGSRQPAPGQQPPWPPAPQHWAAPDPRLVVSPPPSGRAPRHPRRSRLRLVAAMVSAALVLIGILGALPLLSTPPAGAPQPSATAMPVVTVTPSALPGNATTATTGGGLGEAIAFRTAGGSGTVTVNSAVWTDAGDMAAPSGRRYLVVDVIVACSRGSVPVDPLMFLAVDGAGRSLPGFGPTLTRPLGGQVVEAGGSARGQVGYVLTPGAVSLAMLDADLRPVAEIGIPAP